MFCTQFFHVAVNGAGSHNAYMIIATMGALDGAREAVVGRLNRGSSSERRRQPRAVSELLFICVNEMLVGREICFTRNISAGGLMFESPQSILADVPLEILFSVATNRTGSTRRQLRLRVRTRWVREIPGAGDYEGSNRFQVGVVFNRMDTRSQACLCDYVSARMRDADSHGGFTSMSGGRMHRQEFST